MIKQTRTSKGIIWSVNSESWDDKHFEPSYWQSKNKVIGSAKGRGTTWFVEHENQQLALRHYYRGGFFGKLIQNTFLYTGEKNLRPLKELKTLHHLARYGVNVPEPIGARIVKQSIGYTCDILTKKIQNAQDLSKLLSSNELPESMYSRIGQEIRKMHDSGVNHTDLNIHNILVDSTAKVWIIDFDKCSQREGDSWKSDNLKRLLRSFNKEQTAIRWTTSNWQHLLNGYYN
ncbi:3-deoxy-D-manno-octulosonic acid kinase [Vibrio sp. ZSDE26]|uniref:3-deoxy-D-manno-octulosonic acid kinase n=1 Tax=Vibrio amylolyticus TaxID=2847292 RepID=A0A9X2BHQ8_9VIBR|nr:3-deoxy-D-manno-octulosonic acid kinase [Vibrio amylolyticus]MCK6263270.1 3-deoxy-D-manno-octulosonic acid kinase [Vibrio amylolyticus]